MRFFLVAYFKKKMSNSFKNVKFNCSFNISFMGKMPFFLHGEIATKEIVIWENVHLGSCCLGNCTFGKLPLGKLPFGKLPLRKGLWEST